MFYGKIRLLPKNLTARLAVNSVVLFVFSSVSVSAIAYILFSNYLIKNDHSLIEAKWNEYAAVLASGDVANLRQRLVPGNVQSSRLLVQLINRERENIFLKLPSDLTKFGVDHVHENLAAIPPNAGWNVIEAPADEDKLELLGRPIENGLFLRVGRSTDARQDLLENFAHISLVAIILAATLGTLVGILLSRRALMPLRHLVSTMNRVRQGTLLARVPVPASGDEMEELTKIFNLMLDKVESLVTGMRETVDNVAHDIRTPLTRIKAVSELHLTSNFTTEEYRAALEECAESANDTLVLLNSVLELAEAEAGTASVKRIYVHLSELVLPVVDIYSMVAEEKQIEISFDSAVDFSISVDPTKIKQALSNLIDNAIKYSPAGSKISVSAEETTDWLKISVQDQGQGIDPADISRIWDRLFRADKSRSQRGLGIGLSIVRAVAGAHGGTVEVKSELGKGSTFTISLPRNAAGSHAIT